MTLSPLRAGRITGSRVAGVLGVSPYSDRDAVMREMVRQHHGAAPEFTGNRFTEHGNEYEADAIELYEMRYARNVSARGDEQAFIVHPEFDFLGATPDGLVDPGGMVEVKCPVAGTWTHVSERPDYLAQVLLQLECAGREWCDVIVYRSGEIHVSTVYRDPAWRDTSLEALQNFIDEYRTIIADPDLSQPYLEPLRDERTDEEWAAAAIAWSEAKQTADLAEERLAKARQALVSLAPEKTAVGFGVQVIHRKGGKTTAWQRLAKDHGLEPTDEYVSTSAPSVQVRRAVS